MESRYKKEREDPATYAVLVGMSDQEVEAYLRELRSVTTEALVFELSQRGYLVRLER